MLATRSCLWWTGGVQSAAIRRFEQGGKQLARGYRRQLGRSYGVRVFSHIFFKVNAPFKRMRRWLTLPDSGP